MSRTNERSGTKTKILSGKQKVRVARPWKRDGRYQRTRLNPQFKKAT